MRRFALLTALTLTATGCCGYQPLSSWWPSNQWTNSCDSQMAGDMVEGQILSPSHTLPIVPVPSGNIEVIPAPHAPANTVPSQRFQSQG